MIHYDLKCENGHAFDSWFQSAEAFDTLSAAGHVRCSVCGTAQVQKAVMAPRVAATRSEKPAADGPQEGRQPGHGPLSGPPSAAEQAIAELKARIMAETEDVGARFAEEARAIHCGEAPERAIRGRTRPDEARALREEGINVIPLPFLDRKAN